MYSTEKTEKWFARYVDSFRVDGALENMQELKRKHSRRVCAIACAIAESLEWNEEHDAWLAHAIGLLHDTARFEQYRDYKTFADAASFDHGERGAAILAARSVAALAETPPLAQTRYQPRPQAHARYAALYPVYRLLREQMLPVWQARQAALQSFSQDRQP